MAKATYSGVEDIVVMDMAKSNQVASMTQVVPSQEDLAKTGTKHPPKQCPAFRKFCYYCKKGHFSKFCHTKAFSQSQQCKKRDMNDVKNHSYTKQFPSFEFKQDSFNTIHFGRNLKGRGHSNILFDEIDELEQVLTDLCIQGASNPKDYRPVSNQYKGPVLKCRFKVHSGAYGNLLPYNIYHELFLGILYVKGKLQW